MSGLGERSVRIREVEGSNPFRSTKKKGTTKRRVFLFGFRSRWSLHPAVIAMLGRNGFALRQGFACGKTLVTRHSARPPEGGIYRIAW